MKKAFWFALGTVGCAGGEAFWQEGPPDISQREGEYHGRQEHDAYEEDDDSAASHGATAGHLAEAGAWAGDTEQPSSQDINYPDAGAAQDGQQDETQQGEMPSEEPDAGRSDSEAVDGGPLEDGSPREPDAGVLEDSGAPDDNPLDDFGRDPPDGGTPSDDNPRDDWTPPRGSGDDDSTESDPDDPEEPAEPPCGNDGTCAADETAASCPEDCSCGDDVCDSSEDLYSCPDDCLHIDDDDLPTGCNGDHVHEWGAR